MGLYSGGLIIGRIFACLFYFIIIIFFVGGGGAYYQNFFLGGGGWCLLSEFYSSLWWQNLRPIVLGFHWCKDNFKLFNSLSPSVKIQTLLTGIHTFSYDTNWENLLKIMTIFIWSSHPWFSLPSLLIYDWYCREKSDAGHSWGLKTPK